MKRRHPATPRRRVSRYRPGNGGALKGQVAEHVEQFIGPVSSVISAPNAGRLPIDLLWVAPGPRRRFHTLVTSGMSARPMSVPEGACRCSRYAELLLRLPPEWPLGPELALHATSRWPLDALNRLARFPHRFVTHLGLGHTVTTVDPGGDMGMTFETPAPFRGWLLRTPAWAPQRFRHQHLGQQRRLDFFSVVPLHGEELTFAYDEGSAVLFEHLDQAGVTDLLDPLRPNLFAPVQ